MAAPNPHDRVTRLAALDTATVHEAAGRAGDLDPRIRPIQAGATLAGRAVTARGGRRFEPGDYVIMKVNRGRLISYERETRVDVEWIPSTVEGGVR